jgi:hypothetical protein
MTATSSTGAIIVSSRGDRGSNTLTRPSVRSIYGDLYPSDGFTASSKEDLFTSRELGDGGGLVSSCLRDVVNPSRSFLGREPAIEGDSAGGGGVEDERLGNLGMVQLVEERRMTDPTREF